LAFHLYPQVIPQFCNTGGFGPRGLTPASPCPWVAHLVSGRILATRIRARFRLAFAPAPALYRTLTSRLKVRKPQGRCQHTLAGSFYKRHAVRRSLGPKSQQMLPSDCLSVQGFRGSFIPLPGCFSPFPHGTGSLSVARSIRALEGGPPSFPQGFSCPVVLRYIPHVPRTRRPLRDSHPLRWAFPDPSRASCLVPVDSLLSPGNALSTPSAVRSPVPQPVWAPARFARHYYGPLPRMGPPTRGAEPTIRRPRPRLLIPLPRGTEMFQFPRCPPPAQIQVVSSHHGRGVAPFGFGWLFACMQLPNHVSPRSASFFGSWPLGIHPAPSPAWRLLDHHAGCCALRSLATRSQDKSATRIGKYEKTFDNVS
jgi:hypothetical protein